MRDQINTSYVQILKSTSIIGGSSIINIFLRIIRTKFMAVLLGPSGVGLIGIYDSITTFVSTIAGMGVQTSGVRQIAEAAATNDRRKITLTTVTLRRVSLLLGMFGMALLILLSKPISLLTFGTEDYSFEIASLSIIALFMAISGGQTALVQGMRRIGDLAKLSVLGTLFGTIFSIPIVYIWGQKGIVLFLIVVAAMGILTSWWYARKIEIVHVRIGWSEIRAEVKKLLRFGIVFMATAVMATGSMYLVRIFVIRHLTLDAAGLYQAAATLSILYAGFILDAMGKDYYPRLTAIAEDNTKCNQLINEQTEVAFLLSVPGILATLTFAPLIIHLFYSAKFVEAYEVLRWQILGILLRVANSPMGIAIAAKGKMKSFFCIDLLSNLFLIGLTWFGILFFALPGTGMAFFATYILNLILIFLVLKRMTGFTWSSVNIRHGLLIASTVMIVFLSQYVLTKSWHMILGGCLTLAFGGYSIIHLTKITGLDGAENILSRIIKGAGFVR